MELSGGSSSAASDLPPKYRFFLFRKIKSPYARWDVFPFLPLYLLCVCLMSWYELFPSPPQLSVPVSVWQKPLSLTCVYSAILHLCPRSLHHFRPLPRREVDGDSEITHTFLESEEFAVDNMSVCFGGRSDNAITSTTAYISKAAIEEADSNMLTPESYKWAMICFLVFILQALVWLVGEWSVRARCWLCYHRIHEENILSDGTHVLVVSITTGGWEEDHRQQQRRLCPVMKEGHDMVYILHDKKKLLYSDKTKRFEAVKYPVNRPLAFYLKSKGLMDRDDGNMGGVKECERLYGRNQYDIPMAEFRELLKEHAVSPFFVFQVVCVTLWVLDDYWQYGIVTLLLLFFLECQLVSKRMKEIEELRSMRIKPQQHFVYRGGTWSSKSSETLLPGDLFSVVRSAGVCPADCLVLQGTAVVNESMLTGESVAQMKVDIQDLDMSQQCLDIKARHKQHTIFAGTTVMSITNENKQHSYIKNPNGGAICYVLRTGFQTTQGKLVRTIVFSSERVTVSSREALYFLFILLLFAISASVYVLREGLRHNNRSVFSLVLSCSHIITSVVPPEFPITLSLAVTLSLVQLVSKKIFCTEPFRVPYAGSVDVCAFDKTGTLTSDNMEVVGVVGSSVDRQLCDAVTGGCHSLTTIDSELVGDPMDKAAMEWSGWTLTGPGTLVKGKERKLNVLKRFVFSSALQRATSIVKIDDQDVSGVWVVCKGAPEKMKEFLIGANTGNYDSTFAQYTIQGYRVLCLAGKKIDEEWWKMDRSQIETGLQFGGFLVLRCPIKDNTIHNMRKLKQAGHELVMITGDNVLTACEVCKDVGMVGSNSEFWILDCKEAKLQWCSRDGSKQKPLNSYKSLPPESVLCVTGPALSHAGPSSSEFIPFVTVFGRVSPQQKQFIVTSLNRANKITLMCGDGTNDVGALKAAHIGVSLLSAMPRAGRSKQKRKQIGSPQSPPQPQVASFDGGMDGPPIVRLGEASIASPFTYKGNCIRCIPFILRSGRATLATVIMMYKLMALNSLVTAFALSVLTLDGVKLGDLQSSVEGVFAAILHLMLSKSRPAEQLSPIHPVRSIFDPTVLFSLVAQTTVHFATLILGWRMAASYRPWNYETELDGPFRPNLVNTVVFYLLASMHASSFLSNYVGKPFMTPLCENRGLVFMLLTFVLLLMVGVTEICPAANAALSLVPAPDRNFKWKLTGLVVCDVCLSWFLATATCQFRLWRESRKRQRRLQ
eukprot:GHVQ01004101.1.p1 GENE.GHVQ01004101.1~~GHVQ01004101.1.p1  ORF type:complete len:1226 (+),score=142.92 GHVQ01004101.1:65-3742(+)